MAGTQILSQERSGTSHYYLTDGQRNVRALSNGSATTTDTYHYDAYGTLRGPSGSTENPYRYTGQRFDEFTDLYNLRARSYDPNVGRFLSRDTWPIDFNNPIELNRYGYTANNPINGFDPTGRLFAENSFNNATVGTLAIQVGNALALAAQSVYANSVAWIVLSPLLAFAYPMFEFVAPLSDYVFHTGQFADYLDWTGRTIKSIGEAVNDTVGDWQDRLQRAAQSAKNQVDQLTDEIADAIAKQTVLQNTAAAVDVVVDYVSRTLRNRRNKNNDDDDDECKDWTDWQPPYEITGDGGPDHHIATNKNSRQFPFWTLQFRPIFQKANLSMNNRWNRIRLMGHSGPHPQEYHSEIYSRLYTATIGLKCNPFRHALQRALWLIKGDLTTPGDPLRVLVVGKID